MTAMVYNASPICNLRSKAFFAHQQFAARFRLSPVSRDSSKAAATMPPRCFGAKRSFTECCPLSVNALMNPERLDPCLHAVFCGFTCILGGLGRFLGMFLKAPSTREVGMGRGMQREQLSKCSSYVSMSSKWSQAPNVMMLFRFKLTPPWKAVRRMPKICQFKDTDAIDAPINKLSVHGHLGKDWEMVVTCFQK